MAKSILYSDKARRALEKGINTLSEVVGVTLGPLGRNVVLGTDFGVPQIINDGITIAKSIELADHIENTGVSLIRQAAAKTNDAAGDGTTTAIVLASAIVKAGLRNVAAGANAIAIRDGIEKATRFVVEQIAVHARPVKDDKAIAQVGTISAGNDSTIGEMIATAMAKVGREGVLTLEEGKSMMTELEVTEGMRFDQGYISSYFMTNTERMETLLEEPYILLVDGKVNAIQDLVPLLEAVSAAGKPLLIIAEEVGKDVLATLVLNQLRGTLRVAAVKAPGFGGGRKAILQDIAALVEGQVISEETGLTLDAVTLEMLGQARRITLTQANTTIVAEGNGQFVKARCQQLRRELEDADADYEKESLQNRLAKLSGGVAVIKVGAATETEMKDRKYKLEDAINATKAAVEEGIVPGGGATLAHLAPQLETWAKAQLNEEELTGALIVARALSAPLQRIADNAGQNGAIIVEKIKDHEFNVGYDALANKFVNMFEAGIVDPAKVTRSALQNASSIAAITLTTECIVAETSNSKKSVSASTGDAQFDY
ncbi:MAG: chaperonin GroEL [Phormidesmis sp.]